MKTINRILVILESRNGRHYGFRYIRCADGAVVEGHISGGESNLKAALLADSKGWHDDYFYTTKETKESVIFGLPYVGCHPDEIRAWVEKQLPAFAGREKKVEFCEQVLRILEEHRDWSADTADEIGGLAMDLDLAHIDKEGYFKVGEPPPVTDEERSNGPRRY